jgi:recombinational DNA repair protein RecT
VNEGNQGGAVSPPVPPRNFKRCHRCMWLDREDFFDRMAKETGAKAACRKCGFTSIEEPRVITEEEKTRILSGFYEEYKKL